MESKFHRWKTPLPPSRNAEWTLADFLSTYRYWAVFFSSLLLAIGGQGFSTVFPVISQMTGNSAQTIGIFYSGSTLGWVAGAFLAFIVASRHGRSALISPFSSVPFSPSLFCRRLLCGDRRCFCFCLVWCSARFGPFSLSRSRYSWWAGDQEKSTSAALSR